MILSIWKLSTKILLLQSSKVCYGLIAMNFQHLVVIDGEHVYNRFLILSCDNVVAEDERDPELLDKLEAESDVIASVAVQYLRKAIERNYTLTESERTIANRKEYEIRNNSLSLYLTQCCDVTQGRTQVRIFKEKYIYWCKENGLPAEKPNSISKILKEEHNINIIKSNTEYYCLSIKS